ncbi:MAG: hypothetical protein J6R43_02155 [Paludibacteraceae bacterium]|nr:hypothetical protein [Paludibacteraceae bacterium]
MENYIKTCSKCGKKFQVQVTTMNVPGGKEKEEIFCPYCGSEEGYRMTSGFVYTYKLED